MDFEIIFSYLHIIFILLIAIMLLKFFIIYIIVKKNEDRRVSVKTALSLVQIGEFSLALLELARTNSLIGQPHDQVMIATITISMVLTPFILKNLTYVADKLAKRDEESIEIAVDSKLLQEHTVIIGFGEFGRAIADIFKKNGELYVAIESNIDNFHKAYVANEPVIFGNGVKRRILAHANIKDAKSVIVAIDNPKKIYHLCQTIQRFIPNDKIIVKVHSNEEKHFLNELGINTVIVENQLTSNAFFELTQEK